MIIKIIKTKIEVLSHSNSRNNLRFGIKHPNTNDIFIATCNTNGSGGKKDTLIEDTESIIKFFGKKRIWGYCLCLLRDSGHIISCMGIWINEEDIPNLDWINTNPNDYSNHVLYDLTPNFMSYSFKAPLSNYKNLIGELECRIQIVYPLVLIPESKNQNLTETKIMFEVFGLFYDGETGKKEFKNIVSTYIDFKQTRKTNYQYFDELFNCAHDFAVEVRKIDSREFNKMNALKGSLLHTIKWIVSERFA